MSESKSVWFTDFEETIPSLEGKTVLVTGSTGGGMGYVVARTAVRKGAANIILLNRASDRASKAEGSLKAEGIALSMNPNIETIFCDLSDFDSVNNAISIIKSKFESIDVLCNNAGRPALEDVATKDGYDIQMQINHLSHFLLTKELYPLLKKAAALKGDARVCHHTSVYRKGQPLERKYFQKNGGNLGGNGTSALICKGGRWIRYQQSKLANSVFAYSLAKRFEGISGMKSVLAHPGTAATNAITTTAKIEGMGMVMKLGKMVAQSGDDGAMPIIAACFSPSVKNGAFFGPKFMEMKGKPVQVKYDRGSKNEDSIKVLWEESEEACGEFTL